MKIAIFTDTFYPEINGVARTLKRLTAYLEEKHISFKIFAPYSYDNDSNDTHILRIKSLPFYLYPECRLAIPNPLFIKKELQNFAPDVIHVVTPFTMGLCGTYFSRKLKIPLVGSYHTNFDSYLTFYNLSFLSKLLWKYMLWFYRPCKKIFVPSHETMHQLQKHGFQNLDIWTRGVNCELFHPFYHHDSIRKQYGISKKFLITYAGRLAPEKDVITFLHAAKLLPDEINQHIQWLVVGDGPLREELQHTAPENMLFTGYLSGNSLAEVYSASDLFVFPSSSETFGNVVLEALASGTPAICANSGGVKNIINAGKTGELCTPARPQEFAQAIHSLLINESLRKQMGIEGRKYALTQRWEAIFDQLICHYDHVVNEHKKNHTIQQTPSSQALAKVKTGL
ncbi:glycosyltransferase family 1 protein [Bacillus sp. BRMEA1]|uniref:glycosyltransferase family 4 protein n=1 Tax=Neobacillus endophyticus TaxID=2738405 RepID=UPI001566454A|nr:glycosyltransferase family 1 protein [Neobacillus endophyticus]NRD77397.1 glycosyltransferase family 1 protein [Neobacillus endophyticus]